ncbi:multidrug efflux SMR transporter [Nonomuraea sp. NPDC048916]|uniref:DMT family transporter n=1 Tax=Nonomuraea sp. NPDC048916 TaxID=3154232 RepID=UPI0033F3A519
MAWLILIVAGLFEVVMALSLKLSDGFSNVWWSISFFVTAVLSFGLLAYALKSLDVGTAYAVWTGIGAVGTAMVGMLAMGDDASFVRLASIALIVMGIVGLNLAGAH